MNRDALSDGDPELKLLELVLSLVSTSDGFIQSTSASGTGPGQLLLLLLLAALLRVKI